MPTTCAFLYKSRSIYILCESKQNRYVKHGASACIRNCLAWHVWRLCRWSPAPDLGLYLSWKLRDMPLQRLTSIGPLKSGGTFYFSTSELCTSSLRASVSLENQLGPGRRATRGAFGAFAPPKFSKHCIAILTFAETFKEWRWNFIF